MKSFLLVVILAVAASAAVIEYNEPDQALIVPEGAEMSFDDDVEDEVVVNDNFPLPRAQSNLFLGNWNQAHRLVVRETVGRRAVSGQAHDVQETFGGDSSVRISLIQVREVGAQGATVALVSGGINSNRVVLRFRSQVGRGYSFTVEIWRSF